MSSLRTMRSVCSPAPRQTSGPGLGDAITFMAMMRGGHAMVVRPAAVSFSRAQVIDDAGGTVSQPVHLRDGAGRHCRADSLLKRQGHRLAHQRLRGRGRQRTVLHMKLYRPGDAPDARCTGRPTATVPAVSRGRAFGTQR